MEKKFERSLFIFHRDLRLEDNTGLNQALALSKQVVPVFIFDDVQIGDDNKYRSNNAIQFMIESLEDLAKQCKQYQGKLYFFHGDTQDIVAKLIKNYGIDAVISNVDYTPFAQYRDKQLATLVRKHGATWLSYHDALLTYPGQVVKNDGKPYTVFTPFFKRASTYDVPEVQRLAHGIFYRGALTGARESFLRDFMPEENTFLFERGGTDAGKAALRKSQHLGTYHKTRDVPSLKTTGLSAHNKFGTVSIRQVHQALMEVSPDLVRQLYWRDFFTHLAYHFPYVFKGSFHKKYDALEWKNNKAWFEKWCAGTTGFPIVDAGMRQLNTTGYMHNRVRMIVASFLTKDLLVSWRWGERYFAQQLVDYDPCVNNGSWQWVASTGADAQPYFRIFNPWLQQKKFDPDARYIKAWVPELANVSVASIHAWYKQKEPVKNYPLPMIDHAHQAAIALRLFKAL